LKTKGEARPAGENPQFWGSTRDVAGLDAGPHVASGNLSFDKRIIRRISVNSGH
jgi:hypothetical protein